MNLLIPALAAGAAVAGAAAIGALGWSRSTARVMEPLRESSAALEPATFSTDDLDGLPAPVIRYFEFALEPGQPLIRGATLRQTGQFRMRPGGGQSPFTATQYFTAPQPGFVWDARIRMAPLITVRVRDHYFDGEAAMLGKVASLVPVVDQQNTPGLASGALHRALMERAWLPTSLLPSQGVRWEPIDDHSARATLTDAGISVSMDVHFGDAGEIVRVEAERMRDVDGKGVPTPFVGCFSDYAPVDGMMVPLEGYVEWLLPEGRHDFWRGRIDSIDFDFAGGNPRVTTASDGSPVPPRRGHPQKREMTR